LGDSDRDALLLRYFERKSAREMGQIFGTSEEAAQKRVSRAVERLREFFSQRGVAIGASALVLLISANAVQAAPIALAATISTAAILTSATVHTSTAVTATKAITMTLLQKALVTATVTVVAGTGIYEAHQTTQLRAQIQTLQQQQAPLAAQIQQLQQERDVATNQVASLTDEVAKANNNDTELLRLRGEVGALRHQLAQYSDTPQRAQTRQTQNPTAPDVAAQLASAVAQGDPTAIQRLSDFARAQTDFFNTNKVGLSNEQLSALSDKAFSGLWAAFNSITDEAIKGNTNARHAIDMAVGMDHLNGSAASALGRLAGNGDEAALQKLLNPDKNGILLSSAVGALKPAAQNGNPQAIAALAAVLMDPTKKPLWQMASEGLQTAAANGTSVAIEALKSIPDQKW
jgi:hypothetical protein